MEKGEGDGECKNGMRKGKGKEEGQEEGTRWDAVGNVEMRMDPCVRNNWDSSGAGIKTTPQADVGVANTQGGGAREVQCVACDNPFRQPNMCPGCLQKIADEFVRRHGVNEAKAVITGRGRTLQGKVSALAQQKTGGGVMASPGGGFGMPSRGEMQQLHHPMSPNPRTPHQGPTWLQRIGPPSSGEVMVAPVSQWSTQSPSQPTQSSGGPSLFAGSNSRQSEQWPAQPPQREGTKMSSSPQGISVRDQGAFFPVWAAAAVVLNGGIFYGTYREAHVYFINGMPQLSGTPNWYRKCYSQEEARNELRINGFAATADSVEVIDIGGLNAIVRPPKSARSR